MSAPGTACDGVVATPLGRLALYFDAAGRLAAIDYVDRGTRPAAPRHPTAVAAVAQLEHYLEDPCFEFDLPLAPAPTAFQQRLRDALRRIACGTTVGYGELGRALGCGPRAVGAGCRANALPVVVPCHRVVAAGGGLGGYGGASEGHGVEIKRWLLRHEGVEP